MYNKTVNNKYFNICITLLLLFLAVMIFIYLHHTVDNFNTDDTIDFSKNNLFLYWEGYEYKLIHKLRELIYLHSNNGDGYTVHFITPSNLKNYVSELPECFDSLLPAHRADYIRVYVICKYGGIWLDSDVLVLDKLDDLFNIMKQNDGFLIKENNAGLSNGVFGSKPNTNFMIEWLNQINNILQKKKSDIAWTEIGNNIQTRIQAENPKFLSNYTIYNGLDNLYPVNWNNCVEEFLVKPYNNYKNILREFQPIVILCNLVYKEYENEKYNNNNEIPLMYFINKSIENSKQK